MTYADELEVYMLGLINEERTSRGLDPLQLETNLNTSAEEHSDWMLAANVFSHVGEGGSMATERMQVAGFEFSGSWGAAENIAIQTERGAAGFEDDVADLHNSLMESSGHRANILNPNLQYIGIGIEVGPFTYGSGYTGESVIVTQNFGYTQGNVDLDDQGGGGSSAILGTSAADYLIGTAGENSMSGLAGNDTLSGGKGNDELNGGSGGDTLNGGSGKDVLNGGGGKDKLNSGGGNDVLNGGGGKDVLNGGHGNDVMTGGYKADVFVFKNGFGDDIITDFNATNNSEKINLSGVTGITDFADLINNHMVQSGDDVIITQGSNTLTLEDININELGIVDFLF